MKIEDQIKVIDRALINLEHDTVPLSLCMCLDKAIHYVTNDEVGRIGYYIPLFTRENAIKFGNANERDMFFWWGHSDYESRRPFLLWIRKQLKRQLKNEMSKNLL